MLHILTESPLVSETAPDPLRLVCTPTEAFYVRNHFDVPHVDVNAYRLIVEGLDGTNRRELSLDDVRALPTHTLVVTIECAGNSRSFFSRRADGVQFTNGGMSTAEWRGARLRDVLQSAGVDIPGDAHEVWMQGIDEGEEDGRYMAYERSLPLDKALHDDTLLAYEMNGQPLAPVHGAPLRAIVPGWYGMASVKWLRHVKLIREPFTGFFQHDRYRFERPGKGDYQEPVDRMRVKSLILSPRDGDTLEPGENVVEGVAWAGERAVQQVFLSADCGAHWHAAQLLTTPRPYAWTHWRYVARLDRGAHTLMACAVDDAGATQRLEEDWNYRGYANNAAQPVRILCR